MWAVVEVVMEPVPDVAAMVICPAVEVVMVMFEPWIKVAGAYLVPVESAAKSWPCWVGAVVVPVPPLIGAKAPLQPKVKALLEILPVTLVSLITKPTKLEPRVEELVPPKATLNTDWLLSSPLMLVTTPVDKEERVVEPLAVTLNKEELLPLRISITARVAAAEEVAWIITGMVVEEVEKLWMCKRAAGEVVPKARLVPLS